MVHSRMYYTSRIHVLCTMYRVYVPCTRDGDVSNNIFDGNFTVAVYPDGTMWWYTAAILSSTCDLQMAQFPYDEQTCDLTIKKFASSLHNNNNFISDNVNISYNGCYRLVFSLKYS